MMSRRPQCQRKRKPKGILKRATRKTDIRKTEKACGGDCFYWQVVLVSVKKEQV